MTRLEIAEQKLARLEYEFSGASDKAFSHMRLTNGQPMNDKRNGRVFINQQEAIENRIFNKLHQIEEQKERIRLLKEKKYKKENHLTSNYGVETSVYNIEKLKTRKQDKKTRDKVKLLEDIKEKADKDFIIMSEKAKELIASGEVKQWDKKPIYYFVAGLRKVALVVDNKTGEFIVSTKYPPKTEKDESIITELLEN